MASQLIRWSFYEKLWRSLFVNNQVFNRWRQSNNCANKNLFVYGRRWQPEKLNWFLPFVRNYSFNLHPIHFSIAFKRWVWVEFTFNCAPIVIDLERKLCTSGSFDSTHWTISWLVNYFLVSHFIKCKLRIRSVEWSCYDNSDYKQTPKSELLLLSISWFIGALSG